MKCHLLLCLLTLFFTLLQASIVENTCKKATENNEDYNFCVASFQASAKSRSSNKYEFAVIGLELSLANHTYAAARAKVLLGRQPGLGNIVTKRCLEVCSDVYNKSLTNLNTAIESAKHKLPFGLDVTWARSDVDMCMQGFEEAGQEDPLAKENHNAFALDYIMENINFLLHPQQ